MGFRSQGVCYDTEQQALEHWLTQYPQQAADVVYSASAPVKVSAGVYDYTLFASTGANTAGTSSSVRVSFDACDSASVPITELPQASMVLIGVLVIMWALGLSAGLKR